MVMINGTGNTGRGLDAHPAIEAVTQAISNACANLFNRRLAAKKLFVIAQFPDLKMI